MVVCVVGTWFYLRVSPLLLLQPKGNVPVPVVRNSALMLVLQVKWVDVEGINNFPGVLHPHSRAVKVDQHPFVWVEVERLCKLYS